MESGTPGVKSTGDGWLNRILAQSAPAPPQASPFQGRRCRTHVASIAATICASARHRAAAHALDSVAGIATRPSRLVRGRVRRRRRPGAHRMDNEPFEAETHAQDGGSGPRPPRHGPEYPVSAFGQALPSGRAARQSRRRLSKSRSPKSGNGTITSLKAALRFNSPHASPTLVRRCRVLATDLGRRLDDPPL